MSEPVDISGDGGCTKEILQEGTGDIPTPGSEVQGTTVVPTTQQRMRISPHDVSLWFSQPTTQVACWTELSSTALLSVGRRSRCVCVLNPLSRVSA